MSFLLSDICVCSKVNRKMDGDVVGVESTLGVVLDKEVDEKGNKK